MNQHVLFEVTGTFGGVFTLFTAKGLLFAMNQEVSLQVLTFMAEKPQVLQICDFFPSMGRFCVSGFDICVNLLSLRSGTTESARTMIARLVLKSESF